MHFRCIFSLAAMKTFEAAFLYFAHNNLRSMSGREEGISINYVCRSANRPKPLAKEVLSGPEGIHPLSLSLSLCLSLSLSLSLSCLDPNQGQMITQSPIQDCQL